MLVFHCKTRGAVFKSLVSLIATPLNGNVEDCLGVQDQPFGTRKNPPCFAGVRLSALSNLQPAQFFVAMIPNR